ncbi:MAG: lipopolysaccharide biosynthesis protein RfbH [Candidatus Cloacimonetes bacterium]|nr:lipopolysaccharide biosynthesis protein RfbH [Candidatus Cloacimonadota bacterium]
MYNSGSILHLNSQTILITNFSEQQYEYILLQGQSSGKFDVEINNEKTLYADTSKTFWNILPDSLEVSSSISSVKLNLVYKNIILSRTSSYYDQVHQKQMNQEFIPNKSKVNYAGRVFDADEMTNLVDSSLDFWLTYGKYSKKFEKEFAKKVGVQHCLLVNSGSSANLLAFMALTSPRLGERQVLRGDEVITVAAGFPTTIAPIVQYGAVPVFVDVSLENANIDTNALQGALSSKTKAIMIAHSLGNPFDVQTIKDFCNKNNLWLIEDNCDALGSLYNDTLTGSFGDIATSSFYPPHHITMGEGGAVYTSNDTLNSILMSIRDWGRDCWCPSGRDNTCGKRFSQKFGNLPHGYDHKYIYSHFGYNLKATDMQAAIGCAQLDKLDSFSQKRKDNFEKLYNGIKQFEKFLTLPSATPKSSPSWFGFLLVVKQNDHFSRSELSQYLEKNKIQTRTLFGGNMVKQPLFDDLQLDLDYRISGDLNNTDIIMNDAFWIGVYPGMTNEKINYIISKFAAFFDNYNEL